MLPEFTVLQNVMIPAQKLAAYSHQEIKERALERLNWLGIEDQAYKLSSRLSGGQQQRVAIVRALINDPLIIMGDEPTGNLDSNNTKVVFEIFRRLVAERKQTIIAVSHDQDFANQCDRIIEMADGRILF